MLLADYHIVFIILVFILLLVSILLIFVEQSKESIIAGAILCGINWVACLVTYLSFFGVGIIGYSGDGSVTVTTYADMYGFFMLFYGLQWINILLIYLCWYKWTQQVYGVKDAPDKEVLG